MSSILSHLKPESVWYYFEEICKIPRPSKKEEKMIAYLVDFAQNQNLDYEVDDLGNVMIRKIAYPGYENHSMVVLQSHIDMVGEKNADTVHDFEKDPIVPWIDGDWVKAKGTTLGADDGIGIATQLAILASSTIEHGPLECLFTIDEETGLTGAFGLKPDFVKARTLINLDSEDWGEIFIGCAGGRDTKAEFSFKKTQVPAGYTAFDLSVTGLKGGHSGDEIHKGHGNSIKLMNRCITEASHKFEILIASFEGGNARNAIPREAFATVLTDGKNTTGLSEFVNLYNTTVRNEFCITAPELKVEIKAAGIPDFVVDTETQNRLCKAIAVCPHGEQAWSQTLENLVETSTNLATIKIKDNKILIGTSQRSSIASKLDDIVNTVQSVFELAGANVESSDGYPGWEPNPDSTILEITRAAYIRLFGNEPQVRAIHAGLECGLIGEKYPGIDMVSIGPDIKGAHTPEERLGIKSTMEFWDLLLEVLRKV